MYPNLNASMGNGVMYHHQYINISIILMRACTMHQYIGFSNASNAFVNHWIDRYINCINVSTEWFIDQLYICIGDMSIQYNWTKVHASNYLSTWGIFGQYIVVSIDWMRICMHLMYWWTNWLDTAIHWMYARICYLLHWW